MIWGRMGSGGFHGLQIRRRAVLPAEVGSIPTRSRHINTERGRFHDTADEKKTHSHVIKSWLSQQNESKGPDTSFVSFRQCP